jgi:hypothetical protein
MVLFNLRRRFSSGCEGGGARRRRVFAAKTSKERHRSANFLKPSTSQIGAVSAAARLWRAIAPWTDAFRMRSRAVRYTDSDLI